MRRNWGYRRASPRERWYVASNVTWPTKIAVLVIGIPIGAVTIVLSWGKEKVAGRTVWTAFTRSRRSA